MNSSHVPAVQATAVEESPVAGDHTSLSPVPLMQLATGFRAFKTLAAAHELDMFTHLSATGSTVGTAGMTADELGHALGVDERPAAMLLAGCASLGLLEKVDGRYRNSPLAEEFLVRGKPYYFGGIVQMFDKRLYAGWGKLAEALRTNRPTTWDPTAQQSLFECEDPLMLAVFWEAMHSLSIFTARVLGDAIDFSRFARVLDVGGGSGAYDIELCRRYPHLSATVFDLPFVTELAEAKVRAAGLDGRITMAAGDFFADAALPEGHDVILLSMIMYDWSEQHDREILRKCYEALPSGGAVIICELLVNDELTGPPAAALMSLNMLVETERGCNYTPAQYAAGLTDTGFRDIHTVWFEAAGANGAVIGYKP